MAEKFDVEFRKKVKGINPEVPDIVRKRIEETLASLPEVKRIPMRIYSTVAAALILICIAGLGYRSMLSSPKLSETRPEMQLKMATGNTIASDEQDKSMSIQAADSGETTDKNDTSNKPQTAARPSGKVAQGTVAFGSSAKVAPASPQTMNATADLTVSADNGINVELKSASYDGHQIKVQFVKKEPDTGNGPSAVKSMMRTDDKYDMDIIINSIPLECSISIKDAPSSSNNYTGEFVITPESPLPDEFEMGILFKQLGDVSGKWEVYSHIKKDSGN